jgi:hypothetical protein
MATSNVKTDVQKTIIAPFKKSLGNGINAGSLLLAAIDHVIVERDTTVIVKLINLAKDAKDDKAVTAIKTTFAAIYVGAKRKASKDKKSFSLIIKGLKHNTKALKTLKENVEASVSIRGEKWAKSFSAETKPKTFEPAKWAERQVKAQPTQLEAMIAALQAQRPKLKIAV